MQMKADEYKRTYDDSDGTCFAYFSTAMGESCRICGKFLEGCGTYRCPFYKPQDCRGWVRIERKGCLLFLPLDVCVKVFGAKKRS